MTDAPASPDSYDEAVKYLRSLIPMTDAEFALLEADLADRAFTVAQVASADIVADVLDSLKRAVDKGTSMQDWQAEMGQELEDAWGGEKPGRLETIFRTNVQTAYNAGSYEQRTDPDMLDARPYWFFDDVPDSRQSDICAALHGTVLPADDLFWGAHHPPLHFNCRSQIVTLSPEEAEEMGVTTDKPKVKVGEGFGKPPTAGGEPVPDLTGYVEEIRGGLEERLGHVGPPEPPHVHEDRQRIERNLDSLVGQVAPKPGLDPEQAADYSRQLASATVEAVRLADYEGLLEAHPLKEVRGAPPRGRSIASYARGTERITMHLPLEDAEALAAWRAAELEMARSFVAREPTWAVAREDVGPVESAMLHEMGHHLHLSLRREAMVHDPRQQDAILYLDEPATQFDSRHNGPKEREARRLLQALESRGMHHVNAETGISEYASGDLANWVAETHSAFVLYPERLREHDPEAFDILKAARRLMGMK